MESRCPGNCRADAAPLFPRQPEEALVSALLHAAVVPVPNPQPASLLRTGGEPPREQPTDALIDMNEEEEEIDDCQSPVAAEGERLQQASAGWSCSVC
ncbi:hypothetical protein FQA47_002036 [Oryzias melastigma]|uniref:Uncharacterized protein n=1 Tax=Oryzias melastigma TaxID=30732 RepID=A0A834FA77_ORYME|nr:hypothetical protein FQA47_002036 [Oryzias melastigma]